MTKYVALILILFTVCASQISAQYLLKDGKIPKDLVITLSLGGTVQFATYYNYKITSDGEVFYEEFSNSLPVNHNLDLLNLLMKRQKLPKLEDKLSKKQLKQVIIEFEKSDFFEMNEYYQGDPNLKEITCVNHAMSKGLSISANGKTKKVGFFLGCTYGENSPLKKFLNLYDQISKQLSGVKKIKLMR